MTRLRAVIGKLKDHPGPARQELYEMFSQNTHFLFELADILAENCDHDEASDYILIAAMNRCLVKSINTGNGTKNKHAISKKWFEADK